MATATQSKACLVIVGRELGRVVAAGVAMRRTFDTTMVESMHPLRDSIAILRQQPNCLITPITAGDSVVDVRELVMAAATARVLFLADRLPLRAAIARIINRAGHAVLHESEHTAVIEATLVALLAEHALPDE